MFCQSCGAKNADNARFCNMCGTEIAPPGAPGGPLPSETAPGVGAQAVKSPPSPGAAPEPAVPRTSQSVWEEQPPEAPLNSPTGYMPTDSSASMASVSLSAIGVKSSGRAWTVLGLVAVLLIGIGMASMYFAMGGSEPEVVDTGDPTDPDTGNLEIGVPLPSGVEAPEVDFVSGGGRPTEEPAADAGAAEPAGERGSTSSANGRGSGSATGSRGSGGRSGSGGRASGGGRTGGGGPAGGGQTGGGQAGGGQTGGQTGGGQAGGGQTGGQAGGGQTGGGQTGGGQAGGGQTGGGQTGGGGVPDEIPEERDIEMQLYTGRVVFVIRRYYAARARTCFDSATRNDPDLRGTVVIRYTIGAEGSVTRSTVGRNTTGNEALGRCLAGQVRSWRLPAPPGGSLELDMPFSN